MVACSDELGFYSYHADRTEDGYRPRLASWEGGKKDWH